MFVAFHDSSLIAIWRYEGKISRGVDCRMKFGPAYHLMIALASYVACLLSILKSFLVIVIRILLIQEQKDLDMLLCGI